MTPTTPDNSGEELDRQLCRQLITYFTSQDLFYHKDRPAQAQAIVKELSPNIQDHIAREAKAARWDEACMWLQMVGRKSEGRLDSNEWYKLDPRVVLRFYAGRMDALRSHPIAEQVKKGEGSAE